MAIEAVAHTGDEDGFLLRFAIVGVGSLLSIQSISRGLGFGRATEDLPTYLAFSEVAGTQERLTSAKTAERLGGKFRDFSGISRGQAHVSMVANVRLNIECKVELRVIVRDWKGISLHAGSLITSCTHLRSSKSPKHSLGISVASHAPGVAMITAEVKSREGGEVKVESVHVKDGGERGGCL